MAVHSPTCEGTKEAHDRSILAIDWMLEHQMVYWMLIFPADILLIIQFLPGGAQVVLPIGAVGVSDEIMGYSKVVYSSVYYWQIAQKHTLTHSPKTCSHQARIGS